MSRVNEVLYAALAPHMIRIYVPTPDAPTLEECLDQCVKFSSTKDLSLSEFQALEWLSPAERAGGPDKFRRDETSKYARALCAWVALDRAAAKYLGPKLATLYAARDMCFGPIDVDACRDRLGIDVDPLVDSDATPEILEEMRPDLSPERVAYFEAVIAATSALRVRIAQRIEEMLEPL